MTIYYIIEAQDLNSERTVKRVEVYSLGDAKRIAIREQMYKRTVLKISDCSGFLLAFKLPGESWFDTDFSHL